jgi:site-specific recombinase XerD
MCCGLFAPMPSRMVTAPRQPRDRVLLMTVYCCGLRISEATQLKTSEIDRARMQLRVCNGKGAKGTRSAFKRTFAQRVRKLLASANVRVKHLMTARGSSSVKKRHNR